jgi:hypothetical protein
MGIMKIRLKKIAASAIFCITPKDTDDSGMEMNHAYPFDYFDSGVWLWRLSNGARGRLLRRRWVEPYPYHRADTVTAQSDLAAQLVQVQPVGRVALALLTTHAALVTGICLLHWLR